MNNETFRFHPTYICTGDTATIIEGLFTYIARIEHDEDSTPYDFTGPGDCFDLNDDDYGENNRQIIKAWVNDQWHYIGVVVSAYYNGILLDDNVAALWGIECNFPGSTDTSYVTNCACDLLNEARSTAQKHLEHMRDTLAA